MNKITTICISFLLLTSSAYAQNFLEKDTLYNKTRTAWVSGAVAGGWVGSTIALQNIWYQENWSNQFHFFDDSKQWLGMDKIGHAYTGNLLAKNITSLYTWSGVSSKKSIALGSSIALGYMTTLEILDGFSKQWGFSWSDMAANSLGIAFFTGQNLLWSESRIKLKFSAHLSPYAKFRPNVLGSNFQERILKDYNGQTYWLSFTPLSFLQKETTFPKWINISFGYGIDGKLHGENNTYTLNNENGTTTVFHAKSQYLFSLDIDFEKIPTKKPWLRTVFTIVNYVKVPFPALIYEGNKLEFSPFYF